MNLNLYRKAVSKPNMERFDASRLSARIAKAGMTAPDFARQVIRMAPSDMRVHPNYIMVVLRGLVAKPGADYLTLFAKVLRCSRDDFFSEGRA